MVRHMPLYNVSNMAQGVLCLQDPEDELVKTFNDRSLLGKPFVSVNESDEIDVIPCKNIRRRCIFVPCSEGAVLGYFCPVLKNYEHD